MEQLQEYRLKQEFIGFVREALVCEAGRCKGRAFGHMAIREAAIKVLNGNGIPIAHLIKPQDALDRCTKDIETET